MTLYFDLSSLRLDVNPEVRSASRKVFFFFERLEFIIQHDERTISISAGTSFEYEARDGKSITARDFLSIDR